MITFLIAFVCSCLLTLLIVRYEHLHAHLTADHELHGIQKFHVVPVPRVGGMGILFGAAVGLGYEELVNGDPIAPSGLLVLGAAIPAFGAGFIEDLTKRVGVRERLLATALAAALGGICLGAWLTRLDLPFIDSLLRAPVSAADYLSPSGLITVALTCVAVAGVANAFNIIDGYNGLSAVVAITILLGLAYVAHQVGDQLIIAVALGMVGAIGGFLIWNYPRGLIFLGDGGAYLAGFMVAELSVLLVARNPVISPWFPLLLNFYPIFETLFTIFRRMVIGKRSPGLPDAAHLHQLIYRRVVRWAVGSDQIHHKIQRNALTAPYLWVLSGLAVMPAMLFWRSTALLACFVLLFGLTYTLVYRCIIKRKIPRWITIRKASVARAQRKPPTFGVAFRAYARTKTTRNAASRESAELAVHDSSSVRGHQD